MNSVKTFVNHVLEGYNLDPIKEGMLGCIDNNQYFFGISGYSFLEVDDDIADDRDIFLAPPPPVENQYINLDAPIPGLNKFLGGGHSIYTIPYGGFNMNRNFNTYKAGMPYTPQTPTRSFLSQQTNDGQDINLVNVNNIHLNNNSDLAAAARDISEAFSDNAKASAEAMAELQKRGCKANINLTTINNFYVDSSDEGNDDSIIDIQPTDPNKK